MASISRRQSAVTTTRRESRGFENYQVKSQSGIIPFEKRVERIHLFIQILIEIAIDLDFDEDKRFRFHSRKPFYNRYYIPKCGLIVLQICMLFRRHFQVTL